MQIRDTAVATADKPAIIMHPSGTVVTFDELRRGPTGWPTTSAQPGWARVTPSRS